MQFSPNLKGRFFETIASMVLRLQGCRILAKNRRTIGVEADILALKGRTLLVVEVKYRQNRTKAHQALHPKQRQRLRRQANELQHRYPNIETVQLDVVLFFPHAPFMEYLKNPL